MLSDPAGTQVALVTLAEETPVNETVETAFYLEDRVGVHLAPVIVNGLYPSTRPSPDANPDDAAAAATASPLRMATPTPCEPPPPSAAPGGAAGGARAPASLRPYLCPKL